MLFSRCVFTCMPLAPTTCLPSNASCVMFRAPYTMICISIHPILRNLFLILMLIGVDVLTSTVLPPAIVCFLVTTSFPGLPRDNPHSLALVQKPSTGVLLMWYMNLVGYTIFSWSFISHSLRLLCCIVIMLVPSTFLVIQYNISALNKLRWTFTLFKKRSLVAKHASFMFLLVIRLLISSPKAYLVFFLMISRLV